MGHRGSLVDLSQDFLSYFYGCFPHFENNITASGNCVHHNQFVITIFYSKFYVLVAIRILISSNKVYIAHVMASRDSN